MAFKKGEPKSLITRQKMSLAKKGKNHPNFGKPRTVETRRKMSLSAIGKHAGEKSPCWKGGISFEPYCVKFNDEFKERVRAFFGYQCQLCGHIWKTDEPKLSVHHVNYRKDSCCNTEVTPLFVAVCRYTCHAKTNHNREYWEKFFTDIINEKYGGKCYFSKEEMKQSLN